MAARHEQLGQRIHRSAPVGVIIVVVFIGIGAPACQAKTPQTEQPQQRQPRRDAHGDPLPPRAIARLGTLRFRGVLGCLTFSPEGKWLAAATAGGGVILWETNTGREDRRIDAPAMYLSFSPDGKRLACSDNLHCHILDVSSGKKLFAVDGTHGIFAGDGKTLVTAVTFGRNPRVRVWDAVTGTPLLQEFPGLFQEVAVAADGRTVAVHAFTEEFGGAVQVADLSKGTAIRTLSLRGQGRQTISLTPDGKTLATANDNGVRLWDAASGKKIRAWSGRVGRPVFSPNGKQLAWVGFGERGAARLWTVDRDGDQPRAVGEPVHNFEPPCFSPNGKLLAVVTDAHVISLRDVASGKEAVSFDAHTHPVIDVAFSADGSQVISRGDNDIYTWQTRSGKLLRRSLLLPPGHEFAGPLLPNGYLLTGERTNNPTQGRFWLRDMGTGEKVIRFEGRPDVGPPKAVAAPGGRFVAVRGRAGEMCVLDVRARHCVYRLADVAFGVKLSANGDVLVWYNRKPREKAIEVHVHRHAVNKTFVLRDLPKSEQLQWCLDKYLCLSPDGRWLILPTEQGCLRRWDLTTGEEAAPLTGALRTVWELVWTVDGRFVAVQGSASPANVKDREALRDLRVWNVRSGKRLVHLTVPNRQGGMHVLFAHDGRTMLTTDLQGVIYLWEVATGQERGQLRGHLPFEIGALALSPDYRILVSGGYDSQGFVLDLTGRMPDGQWHPLRLSAEQRRTAWEALASSDAEAAYRAMWQLTADPEGTIALVNEKARPIARPRPGQVERLIAGLDSAEFAERERAAEELEKLGESAAAELRQTLARKPSLEMRRRIEALLEKLESLPRGRQLQALRAVEVLEHIATPEARKVLRKLAEDAAAARLTQQAQDALKRCEALEHP